MSAVTVSAKAKNGNQGTAQYDLPDTVEGLVEAYGADVVYTKAKQSIVIDAQAHIRRQVSEGKEADLNGWKPTNRAGTRLTPADKAKKAFTAMSAEDRKELLKSLKAEGLV